MYSFVEIYRNKRSGALFRAILRYTNDRSYICCMPLNIARTKPRNALCGLMAKQHGAYALKETFGLFDSKSIAIKT